MKNNRPLIAVIVILMLGFLAGGYYGIRALIDNGSTGLSASGSIEAVEVTISPEIGGKISIVTVNEGDNVKVGDILFTLDDTLLNAQRVEATASLDVARGAISSAEAALTAAQANYDVVMDSARREAINIRIAEWISISPSGYTLPGWYYSQDELVSAVQTEVAIATTTRDEAQIKLDNLQKNSSAITVEFLAVEKRLNETHQTFVVADEVLTKAKTAKDNEELQLAAQKAFDSAKTELDDAQNDYDRLKDYDLAKNILTARAELAAAQERLETAQDHLLALQTGENSPQVTVAKAALEQAQTSVNQANLSVKQAEAGLALIDAQIAKLTISAPASGSILMKSIQSGEIIAPSAPAMTLGRLDNLTITVYIPEDRYGEISLGQSAEVSVDSFPGESFTAIVSNIAEQAEFTPRNVQTVEGRSSTVFAIKLQVIDPSGKLKPGMPADVIFE